MRKQSTCILLAITDHLSILLLTMLYLWNSEFFFSDKFQPCNLTCLSVCDAGTNQLSMRTSYLFLQVHYKNVYIYPGCCSTITYVYHVWDNFMLRWFHLCMLRERNCHICWALIYCLLCVDMKIIRANKVWDFVTPNLQLGIRCSM